MAITISREDLDEYREINTERKELDRRSRALAKRCKQVEAQVLEQLQDAGKTSAKRFDYTLTLTDGRPSVKWQDQFILVAGPDEAQRLIAEADTPQKAVITW